jgi:arylsulfatase A
MKPYLRKFLLAAFVIALALPAMAKPNFIVIFIDDMGYGDIGPFGSTKNETPHLDRMAKEGMKLTSFYVASPVCSPSRAALMTGSYPKRVGLAKGSGHVVLFPGDVHGLNPKEITIAEVLKNEGYATGCFGKWHLGDQPEFLPTSQGFDEYYGIPYSNDMWPGLKRWKFPHLPILRGTKVIDQVDDMDEQAELCRLFTEEAVKFIEKNKDGPFFVYLPHAFVHGPRKASPAFMAKAKTVEEAQVEEVDWSAGQILDAVRKAGIEKNTFVLFTSDNGGAGGLSSAPLRGGKGSAWEGGVREPTIAWWPGKVPAGSVCKEIASTMDLLPTFANWAGGKVPDDRVIDGRDVGDLFLGKPGAKTPHDRFFYHQADNLRAVRSGPWKLFRNGPLYNLEEDLGEKKNVAAKRPGVVKRLKGYMAEFERDLKKNSRPIGKAKNPRTLVPRPGAEGEDAYTPTLLIGKTK